MRYLLILIAGLMLAGCSTNPGMSKLRDHANLTDYNPQNFQGCTVGSYERENGDTIRWWDCKDKATVAGSVDLSGDGEPDFTYSASDVVGSDAAAIRAEVEKVFAEQGADVSADVINGIVDAIIGL